MTVTKKSLERVQLTDIKIKLVMSERILNQVQYLCREIPKVEWSGILFYSVEGSIKDPKDMVLTIEDILPMDKGTQAYTEYTLDDSVVEYMMDNETMEKGWKMGHIHSHNTMAVFFSGTDWAELEDNAPNHNLYLSLIVNNFMDFCAKVCFIAEANESKLFSFKAKDYEGNVYTYAEEPYGVVEKKLISYDCEIDAPINSISIEDTFSSRVSKIIKDADEKAARFKPTVVTGWKAKNSITTPQKDLPSYKQSWDWDATDESSWNPGVSTIKGKNEESWDSRNRHTFLQEMAEETEETYSKKGTQSKDKTGQELEDEITDFSMYVINIGNPIDEKHKNVEDIISYYKTSGMTPNALAKKVLEGYTNMYDTFYREIPEEDASENFIMVTELTIEELEDTKDVSMNTHVKVMLHPTIEGLKSMLSKFKKFV